MRHFKRNIYSIKIIGFPPKIQEKTNYHKYGMFISGSLLAISEYLPFSSIQGNGVLDIIKKIRQEYDSNLK